MSTPDGELTGRVVRSGGYLVVRRGLSTVVQVVGVVVMTALIGAGEYGRYAGGLAFLTFVMGFAPLGIDIYLVRAEEVRSATWRQANALLVTLSVAAVAVGLAAALVLDAALGVGFAGPLAVLTAAAPLWLLALPAIAGLERELRYRAVATIEFVGDLGFYAVALPLAAADAGVWAPVAGFLTRRAWTLLAAHTVARVPRGLAWDADERRPMVGYGLGIVGANGFVRLSELVNPIVVGHFGGAAAVGQVALAQNLVDRVSFAREEAKRLSFATFGRIQGDRDRLARAHRRGTTLQVLVVGIPLAGFAIAAPWLVPTVFGDDWPDVPELVALLGVTALAISVVNLHTTVLQTYGHHREVIVFRAVKLVLFAGSAVVLVSWLGVVGYGWAQVVRFSANWLLDRAVRRIITPDYGDAVLWAAALAPLVVVPLVPWPTALLCGVPVLVAVVSTRGRRILVDQVRDVRAAVRAPPAGDDQSLPSSSS